MKGEEDEEEEEVDDDEEAKGGERQEEEEGGCRPREGARSGGGEMKTLRFKKASEASLHRP